MAGAKRPWQAAGLLLFFLGGCGAQYRPVVTPITPTGPASQPAAYFLAISSPSPTAAGLVTEVDAFGDTIVAQATLANGPFSFTLNGSGAAGYNLNSNATVAGIASGQQGIFTLNSYGTAPGTSAGAGSLRTQAVSTSTIPATAFPFNIFTTTTGVYLIEPYIDPATMLPTGPPAVAQLTGNVPALQQEIPVAPNPVNFAVSYGAPRLYSLSQGSTAGGAIATPNACETPSSVTTAGEADAIELTTNTVSNRLPLGICPVYGLMSPDFLRAFVLNRGSGTITVINSQTNSLDTTADSQNPDATVKCATPGSASCANITIGGGPVYADLYAPSSLLVTANFDSDSVSVLNVPTDVYGNDGPTFGTPNGCPAGASGANCAISLKPAGSLAPKGPIAVTILRDGSRAYVANQDDCTVSVVNLTSFVVTKTIPLGITNSAGEPCHPKAIASVYSTPAGKVYVASSDSKVLVAINTETDTVSASVQLPGNAVTVYSTTQNAATGLNSISISNASGLGVPCASTDTSPFCPGQ
jgi:YVTN family beta-propeller protein